MTYRTWLHLWCIVRHLPNAQYAIVERFRNRGEAELYLQRLGRMLPAVNHSLVFDPVEKLSSLHLGTFEPGGH